MSVEGSLSPRHDKADNSDRGTAPQVDAPCPNVEMIYRRKSSPRWKSVGKRLKPHLPFFLLLVSVGELLRAGIVTLFTRLMATYNGLS